ncbi:MAG: hypothetical protein QHJ73_02370 [Armatimonadota bacterium]|nr:hypothetical protein [Armatimonadota bacterium]
MFRYALLCTLVVPAALAGTGGGDGGAEVGVAARYASDAGIERDPAVIFVEGFEQGGMESLKERWSDVSNRDGKALRFSTDVPPGSAGRASLQVTATRGQNTGGHLFRLLKPGYDQLYCRFYVKFAPDHGFVHHFVKLQGESDPPPYPVGRAGLRPVDAFTTGIEPTGSLAQTYPARQFDPPGVWHFYTYWPEMRSWQNPDGSGTSFYGNSFDPPEPVEVVRGKWTCVEFMVKMNSAPERADGEQAFWIDGRPVARFAPGSVKGYWMRDVFRLDDAKGKLFEGFRWRTNPRVRINKLWLLHYVSEEVFQRSERYAAAHPGYPVNTRTATVWFDHLVVATRYIGPLNTTGAR